VITNVPTICVCQRASSVMDTINVATDRTRVSSVVRFGVFC